ncbi:MAG TPA: NAD(P)-dependent oxidoreductase [Kofleriaceae bacterium]|jgi:3-hydroxyisobutyrate dehydrogenase|nr:NAD(P)-dependent oxidoreductase [Kofleriaceae bacterium]
MSKLGWIGLGAIGTPMALRLLDAGHELHVWGRTSSRLQPALDRGARAAASAAELAATCEAVLLCVTDTEAVETVALGPHGLAEGAKPGLLVIDHSTADPARTRALAERVKRDHAIAWLDAPVSGGAPGARAGTLSIFVGGDEADVERARPWLAAYGQRITHLGAAGMGQAAKSCNQAIFGTTIAVWLEVLDYARAIGLDAPQLVAALEGSWSDSPVRKHLVPHFARARTLGDRGLLHKDLDIVADTARAHDIELPLTTLAAARLRKG